MDIQTVTEFIIPPRITFSQFGCSPKIWNAHVKDKPLPLKGISPDGQFFILGVAGEDYMVHKDTLVSDEEYQKQKDQEMNNWLAKQEENSVNNPK